MDNPDLGQKLLTTLATMVLGGYIVKILPTPFNKKNTLPNNELVEIAKQENLEKRNHRSRQRRKSDENLYAICVSLLSSGVIYWSFTLFFPIMAVAGIVAVSAVGSFILAKLDYSIATDKLFPPFKP